MQLPLKEEYIQLAIEAIKAHKDDADTDGSDEGNELMLHIIRFGLLPSIEKYDKIYSGPEGKKRTGTRQFIGALLHFLSDGKAEKYSSLDNYFLETGASKYFKLKQLENALAYLKIVFIALKKEKK